MSTGAVILAGGLARRMGGQDKGLVPLAGAPMVSYSLKTVLPLVDRCVINANRHLDTYEQFGVPVITDQLEGHLGPLAGLSAGIDALDTDYIFMCPCDSPFLQADLFEALLQGCIEADADLSVPHDGQRLQPIFVVVHRRVKASLDAFLSAGHRKIDRWFDELKVLEVPAESFVESFRNINTEEERSAAEQDLLQ